MPKKTLNKATNGIYISELYVYPSKREETSLKAFVRLVLNDQLVLSSLRIIEGRNGLFVAYPEEFKKEEDKSYPYVLPITQELRDYVNNMVLEEYVSQVPEYSLSISEGVEKVVAQSSTLSMATH